MIGKEQLQRYSDEQLRLLNRVIVDELKRRTRIRDMERSREFQPGDRIEWLGRDGVWRPGVIKSVNMRTATLEPVNGTVWRVGWDYIRKPGEVQ